MWNKKKKLIDQKDEKGVKVHYVKSAKIPLILVIAVIVLSSILGIIIGGKWQREKYDKSNHKVEITADVLQQKLEQIGELATVSYYYTNMGKYEDALQLFDHNVPFTSKSFIISYDGVIKAGIDIAKIEMGVDNKGDNVATITIKLPKAMITSHEVDMDSVTIFDEKNSIFNGLSAEDVTGFLTEQDIIMEEKAKNHGILMQAEENAKDVLHTLLNNIVTVDNPSVTYEFVYLTIDKES